MMSRLTWRTLWKSMRFNVEQRVSFFERKRCWKVCMKFLPEWIAFVPGIHAWSRFPSFWLLFIACSDCRGTVSSDFIPKLYIKLCVLVVFDEISRAWEENSDIFSLASTVAPFFLTNRPLFFFLVCSRLHDVLFFSCVVYRSFFRTSAASKKKEFSFYYLDLGDCGRVVGPPQRVNKVRWFRMIRQRRCSCCTNAR